jgi:hypothetical protein
MDDGLIEGREILSPETGTIALLQKAEIDQQIATAHRFPRSLKRFRDEALQMVTLDETIASECIYALPRDGKTIEGPSARFAEVIASAWGNCRAGARVVDDKGEFVTSQGVFHDLERNVAITYEVQRRIIDKRGKRYSADMIGVTANAACSIALRNAILKGVPKAFWSSMYGAARQVIMGDIKTLGNRRASALKEFQRYGIKPEQICAKLEVPGVEDIGLDHLVTLRGLLTAIREGDTTPEQAFAPDTNSEPIKTPQPKSGRAAAPPQPETVIEAPNEEPETSKPTPVAQQPTGDEPRIKPGMLSLIRTKAAQRGMAEQVLCDAFSLNTLEDATVKQGAELLDYIAKAQG